MWPWHTDRLVLLGDAARATSPQLGRGANLALIDAVVLAEVIAAEPTIDRRPMPLAELTRLLES